MTPARLRRSRLRRARLVLVVGALLCPALVPPAARPASPGHLGDAAPNFAAPADTDSSAVAELQREAIRLRDWVQPSWVREFLAATSRLPHVATRTVLYDSSRTH